MARFLCRIVVVCLLVTFLGAPWAAAEPGENGAASPHLLSQLWSWLGSLWGEEGCIIDPDGRCGEAPSLSYQEEGCMLDPDGRCGAPRPSNLEVGCIIDPNGGCRH